jgi:hypothetical protein
MEPALFTLQIAPQMSDLHGVIQSSLRRPLIVASGSTALGVVAFVLAYLFIRGDHRVEQCDLLGVSCGRVHAGYGMAAAGWALLLVGLMALVVAGLRRLRSRRDA